MHIIIIAFGSGWVYQRPHKMPRLTTKTEICFVFSAFDPMSSAYDLFLEGPWKSIHLEW